MSAIASAAQAPANSQPSTQRRVSNRADAPRRASSMATGDSSASNIPHRSSSNSQMPSVSRQNNFSHVARNDHEQTDLRHPHDSRGDSPKGRLASDRSPPRNGDVPRLQHRTTSRSERSGNTDDTRLAHTTTNGTAAESVARSAASAPRRRTNIHTSTGNWVLGKTIGQGSMGKVKLAKNYETGEQVSIFAWCHSRLATDTSARSLSKSCLVNPQTNTAVNKIEREQITPRRFGLLERLPL